MQYTHLGRTGLEVSRLCLGTMNFGPETSEAESFSIMDRALEHGINFFDTADVYGRSPLFHRGEGVTEQILGRWFAQGGGRALPQQESDFVFFKKHPPLELSLHIQPCHRFTQ